MAKDFWIFIFFFPKEGTRFIIPLQYLFFYDVCLQSLFLIFQFPSFLNKSVLKCFHPGLGAALQFTLPATDTFNIG